MRDTINDKKYFDNFISEDSKRIINFIDKLKAGQVPANRIGHEYYTAAQLKTMQEVITLVVFSIFSVLYLKEDFQWNYLVGFILIILAVFVIFKKW